MNRSRVYLGVVVLVILLAAAAVIPQLATPTADAYPGDCILIQNPYWATYTGGEGGCEGAYYNCTVWVFECEQ